MSLTSSSRVVALAIKDLIEDNQSKYDIDRVYYGDQRIIGDGTVVCVEPFKKVAGPATVGYQFDFDCETSVIVYKVGSEGVQQVQEEADELTENLEIVINNICSPSTAGLNGTSLGGLISRGWVSGIEYGYRVPSSQTIRANRMIVSTLTRKGLS